jgi:hypothetical protein
MRKQQPGGADDRESDAPARTKVTPSRPTQLRELLGKGRVWMMRVRSAIVAPISHWDAAEMLVERRMKPEIAGFTCLLRDLEDLAYDVVKAATTSPQVGALIVVHHSLLTRVLHDARAAELVSRRGYTMQGWTLAASAYEAAHMMGFVGQDVSRAERWLKHTDRKNAVVATYDAVLATIRFLQVSEPGELPKDVADTEYRFYEHLCLAKHVNPLAEKTRYVGKRAGQPRLIVTPYFAGVRALEAAQGLMLASRATTTAVMVFHRVFTAADDTFSDRLTALYERLHDLMPLAGSKGLARAEGESPGG